MGDTHPPFLRSGCEPPACAALPPCRGFAPKPVMDVHWGFLGGRGLSAGCVIPRWGRGNGPLCRSSPIALSDQRGVTAAPPQEEKVNMMHGGLRVTCTQTCEAAQPCAVARCKKKGGGGRRDSIENKLNYRDLALEEGCDQHDGGKRAAIPRSSIWSIAADSCECLKVTAVCISTTT